jgi:hypothetical protein
MHNGRATETAQPQSPRGTAQPLRGVAAPASGESERTDQTYARYNEIASNILSQSCREATDDDWIDMATEDRVLKACRWMLAQQNRWSPPYIRLVSNAMKQKLESFADLGLIEREQAVPLLEQLKTARPAPVSESHQHARRRQQSFPRKLIRPRQLRAACLAEQTKRA